MIQLLRKLIARLGPKSRANDKGLKHEVKKFWYIDFTNYVHFKNKLTFLN